MKKATKDICRQSLAPDWRLVVVAFLAAILASACSAKKHTGSLKSFVQSDRKTLVEVIDGEGRAWKLLSVAMKNNTVYFIVNANNRVDLVASVFTDKTGFEHGVVYVGLTDKEEVLSVLDKKFLMGVGNTTEAYKRWVEQKADFAYGSVQDTSITGLKTELLTTGNIQLEGDSIVVRLAAWPCHCTELFPNIACGSPKMQCMDKQCDFINCAINYLNGITNPSDPDCSNALSDANATCYAAYQQDQQ